MEMTMTAPIQSLPGGPGVSKPALPREHGAWGILLVPFASALGVAGVFDLKTALLLASVLCFYLARASYLRGNRAWALGLVAGSVAAALPLVVVWHLWGVAVCGALAAPWAVQKTSRNLWAQLLAVAGLTLTAPAAWYVATGRLDGTGGLLWLLNAAYFFGGILYVRLHIAAAIARTGNRWRLGAPTLAYHLGLVGVALALWPVGAALVPAMVRAGVGVARLTPRLRIKRLAWTEVAHSLLFGLLVVALWRGWLA